MVKLEHSTAQDSDKELVFNPFAIKNAVFKADTPAFSTPVCNVGMCKVYTQTSPSSSSLVEEESLPGGVTHKAGDSYNHNTDAGTMGYTLDQASLDVKDSYENVIESITSDHTSHWQN